MRYFALLLAAACATAPIPSYYESPIHAYPINDSTFDRADILFAFETLLRKSAYGRLGEERAGFLVYDGERFHLVMWPPTHLFHAEKWHGAIPAGTVAVVHTHPPSLPEPSLDDRMEAQRVGVPIIVLTATAVEMVTDDGRVHRLRLGMTKEGGGVAYTDQR